MDIEQELKQLDRARALRVIANALRHFSDDKHTLALASTWTQTVRNGDIDVFLISLPPDSSPEELKQEIDEGCQEGRCQNCCINLWSTYKTTSCPFCGEEAHLT